jgi:hypothetical protein
MKDALGDFRAGLGVIALLAMAAAALMFLAGRGASARTAPLQTPLTASKDINP